MKNHVLAQFLSLGFGLATLLSSCGNPQVKQAEVAGVACEGVCMANGSYEMLKNGKWVGYGSPGAACKGTSGKWKVLSRGEGPGACKSGSGTVSCVKPFFIQSSYTARLRVNSVFCVNI